MGEIGDEGGLLDVWYELRETKNKTKKQKSYLLLDIEMKWNFCL